MGTPKYGFITWLAVLNRLSTMDRVSSWNPSGDLTCVLCKNAVETRDHLFFECSYSSQIWRHLSFGILRGSYSRSWSNIVTLISGSSMGKMSTFCSRYSVQVAVYSIWGERNGIRHGERPKSIQIMKKLVDKEVKNKLSLTSFQRRKGMEGSLRYWFGTRV